MGEILRSLRLPAVQAASEGRIKVPWVWVDMAGIENVHEERKSQGRRAEDIAKCPYAKCPLREELEERLRLMDAISKTRSWSIDVWKYATAILVTAVFSLLAAWPRPGAIVSHEDLDKAIQTQTMLQDQKLATITTRLDAIAESQRTVMLKLDEQFGKLYHKRKSE